MAATRHVDAVAQLMGDIPAGWLLALTRLKPAPYFPNLKHAISLELRTRSRPLSLAGMFHVRPSIAEKRASSWCPSGVARTSTKSPCSVVTTKCPPAEIHQQLFAPTARGVRRRSLGRGFLRHRRAQKNGGGDGQRFDAGFHVVNLRVFFQSCINE